MKSYKHLCENLISEENINEAIINASKGKRNRIIMRDMYRDPERWFPIIQRWILNFKNPKHHPVEIYDGISRKKRTIICPTNKEQVVHHAVCNILKPIFMHGMYEHSYGSIPKRGGLAGKKVIEKWLKDKHSCKYVLKMDIHKFFDSVPHDILKEKLKRILKDETLLNLLFTIIDETELGLPLGFYTSQWLSNWYLQSLDHYIKEDLHAVYYMRYMDDMVIFGPNKRELHRMRVSIDEYLQNELGLQMNPKWQVYRFIHFDKKKDKYVGRDLDFMGFRFFGFKTIMRKSIMYKATRKTAKILRKQKINVYDCRQMLSYLGWFDHTDTYNVYLEYIKPRVNIKRMKKRVAAEDKRKHNERRLLNELEENGISRKAAGTGQDIIEKIQLCAP